MAGVMKISLIVLSAIYLAHGSPYGHSVVIRDTSLSSIFDAVDTAIATVKKLGNKIASAVKDGNDLIQKYSDNSTNYAEAFKVNIFTEVDSTITTYNKATAEAAAIAAASNNSVAACFTAKKGEARALALAAGEEIVKCGVTRVKQITDMAVNLATLGSNTVLLIPNTYTAIQNCMNTTDKLSKVKCVASTMSDAVLELTGISVKVATIVTTASFSYATLTADLNLCMMSKMIGLRQRMKDLAITVGSCTQQSIG